MLAACTLQHLSTMDPAPHLAKPHSYIHMQSIHMKLQSGHALRARTFSFSIFSTDINHHPYYTGFVPFTTMPLAKFATPQKAHNKRKQHQPTNVSSNIKNQEPHHHHSQLHQQRPRSHSISWRNSINHHHSQKTSQSNWRQVS